MIHNGKITFSTLPLVDQDIRKILLGWISRAMAVKTRKAKTDQGKEYHVVYEKDGECSVSFEDGNLVMPCFEIVFEEDGE